MFSCLELKDIKTCYIKQGSHLENVTMLAQLVALKKEPLRTSYGTKEMPFFACALRLLLAAIGQFDMTKKRL